MDACRLTEADLERYRTNLEALAEDQPRLAERIEATDMPATVERLAGRDGADTFRILGEDGSRRWFGRSSMPTISAPALVGGLVSQGRNLILPTIATGRETLLASQRLPRHCAVFVYEHDPLALKLALHLHDLSGLMRRRRVVLLCGDDAGTALAEFFAACPGFEYPQQLLPLPLLAPARRDRIQAEIESAGSKVAQRQLEVVERTAPSVRERTGFVLTDTPRVAILSRDPREETIALARRLGHTAQRMGWAAEVSVPDRPDRAHLLVRLEVIHRHRPDLVVLLNCLKGRLAHYLPRSQPVCSWLIAADSVDAARGEGFPGNQAIFAAGPDICERLKAAGATPEQVQLLEAAADTAVFAPLGEGAPVQPETACDVAVLADAHDPRPEAAGITLASHMRLWNELRSLIGRAPDTWRDESAPKLLKRAERSSGTKITDQELRDRFAVLSRQRLVPTSLTRRSIERLVQEGLEVAVWGGGWEVCDTVRALVRGPIPDARRRNAIYNTAGVVLCPHFDQRTAQTVLDCLAAGGCPLYHRPEVRLARLHPQLGEVLQAVPHAASLEGMTREARRRVADAEARRAASERARSAVLERHSLASRLRTMRDCLSRQ